MRWLSQSENGDLFFLVVGGSHRFTLSDEAAAIGLERENDRSNQSE